MNYYNEIDPFCCEWIKNLIKAGEIPDGEIDDRSISLVQPEDLRGFAQCHFFVGISGWPLALKIAGWPEDRPVITGSCPCPPFSSAGKKKSCGECKGREVIPHPRQTGIFACVACGHEWFADGRHLWPEFRRIIAGLTGPLRHAPIFGEQVAGADGLVWLAGVRTTLEELGYGVGALDTCAAGVGAPQIRQRLYWMADAGRAGDERRGITGELAVAGVDLEKEARERKRGRDADCNRIATLGLADAGSPPSRDAIASGSDGASAGEERQSKNGITNQSGRRGDAIGMADAAQQRPGPGRSEPGEDSCSGVLLDEAETRIDGGNDSQSLGLGDAEIGGLRTFDGQCQQSGGRESKDRRSSASFGLGITNGPGSLAGEHASASNGHGSAVVATGGACRLVDTLQPGLEALARDERGWDQSRRFASGTAGSTAASSPWSDFAIIATKDGKFRRVPASVEPEVQRVANGVPSVMGRVCPDRYPLAEKTPQRAGRLKGYGNAIVPHVAAGFIRALMEA